MLCLFLLVSVSPSIVLGVCLSSLVLFLLMFLCFWWANVSFIVDTFCHMLRYVLTYVILCYLVTDLLSFAVMWFCFGSVVVVPLFVFLVLPFSSLFFPFFSLSLPLSLSLSLSFLPLAASAKWKQMKRVSTQYRSVVLGITCLS